MKTKAFFSQHIPPPHICRLWVIVCVLLATHCNWAWGQQLPFKIVDRFGTEYNLNDIVRPPDRAAFDCDGNGDGVSEGGHFNFQLDFLDAAGQGFNDPAKVAYKTVICQVLTDLSYLLDAHPNCAGNKPLLRIEIRPAVYEAPTPNGTLLGAASTYYYNYTNGSQMQTGYAYGNVWRTLNGGEDNTSMPYLIGTNTYHGYMYFNFHNSITWNTAMDPNFSNGAAGKDFYQVVLHETCHMLGIHSWIDSDGTSRVSNPASDPNGLYTAYDKFLIKQSPPTAVLHNTDGCHAVQFNTTTNLLTGGCDQINFKGTQTPTLSLPAYTPTVWADGSSLSHFGNDACNTTPYLMHWSIMNDAAGHAIHRPTNDELTVLCEIGYRVSTPNYTAPAVTATITPTSANNPFGMGVGTAANPVRINGDITIPAGATIIFDGMNFEFGINGRIKVATNGRLIITGSTLRGNPLCQTMWQGIRVQGPGENFKRLTTGGIRNYGIVELTGTVNIEDAIIGAAGMYTPLIPPNALLSQVNIAQDLNTLSTLIMPAYTSNNAAHQTAGGVVRINGHVINFTNCFQGVNLSWYRYNGGIAAPSRVRQGNFVATRTLWYPFSQLPTAAGTITEAGVVLNYYNNINIELSRFTNTLYGIRAFGAYQATFGKNNIFERTNFVDRDMVGISVFNFENSPVTESDVTITDNDFNNLTIGMQCAGTDLNITQNRINATTGTSYAGALLYGCTYTAKNNNIRSCYTGIASQADQNIPNLIKANTFDYCIAGTWARGDDTGLQIVCNDFDHYATGIAMSNATIVAPEPGVLDDQGSCFDTDKNPADNLFLTGTNPPIFPDLLSNTTDSYIYYYRSTGTDYQPTASANLSTNLCPTIEDRAENCADFVLAANDVINIIEGTTQDQEMIKTIRHLVQVDHDTTAAVNLLATVNSRAAKRMALEYYIKKAMFNAAQQLLNSLPTTTQDDQFFKQLSTIKRDLAQSNRSIFELTTTEIASLTNIANYRTRTSFEAQAILYLVQQREFPVQMEHLPAPLPAYTGTLPVVHFKNDATNTHLANAIKVFPNPANGLVTVSIPDNYANAQLSLYGVDGRTIVSQTLHTGNNTLYLQQMQAGLYYYLITLDGNVVERNKLVLIK